MAGFEERLVFFPSGGNTLAGIHAVPDQPNGRTVLMPWGSGAYPSSGRNRIRARLARTIAKEGFHTLRFDYTGVGESGGDYQIPDMAKPYSEEIVAACAWLNAQGLSRIVIVASCFGAWSSLRVAPSISGLEGMALINAPVWRDHKQVQVARAPLQWWAGKLRHLSWAKLRSADHRSLYRRMIGAKAASLVRGSGDRTYSRDIRALVDRRIPILLMYGDGDFRGDLDQELESGLRAALATAGPPSGLILTKERLQGYASFEAQDALLNGVLQWLGELSSSRD